MKSDYEKIRLFKDETYIYLANMSEVAVNSLVYSTFSSQLIDDSDGTILNSVHLFFGLKTYLQNPIWNWKMPILMKMVQSIIFSKILHG